MDLTLREFLDRYGPSVGMIVAIVLLVAIFPSSRSAQEASELVAGAGGTGVVPGEITGSTSGSTSVAGNTASGAPGTGGPAQFTPGGIVSLPSGPGGAAKVCRKEDGRTLGISRIMPTCVPVFSGNNGGDTARGVTGEEVVIVRYMARTTAATQAALIAAGADDEREDQDRMDAAIADYFAHHYETYGRAPKIITMDASGASADDSAMRADAKTIADKHKAFIAWGAPDTLAEELSARGVICICTTSLSDRFYATHKHKIFSSLPSAEEYMTGAAEYVGKRLYGKAPAHAGSPIHPSIAAVKRKIGLLYLEATSSGPRRHAKDVRDFFLAEARKYGINDVVPVGYSSDLTKAQEQTSNVISKFIDEGVTTVVLAADPLFPIFLTKEATKQTYQPEWIIIGTALTDTTFFGRTYDPPQWRHAFGISPLWVFWVDVSTSGGYREYHHMRPGSNRGDEGVSINVRRSPIQWIFQGIHMAGPLLTPETFAQGMYNFPRSGGVPDVPLIFFTPEHPNAIKDWTEVWWKPDGSGLDETGKNGPGTLMKVDGGKRWLTGTWPSTVPKVFVNEGAVYTKDFADAPKHEQDGHKHDVAKQKCRSCPAG